MNGQRTQLASNGTALAAGPTCEFATKPSPTKATKTTKTTTPD